MKKVYVAGAISSDKLENGISNLRRGILMGAKLLRLGFAPYVPHLDYQFNLVQDDPIPVETYYKYDLTWLESCDCVLVLPNSEKSKGVQAEIAHAKRKGIPIFTDVRDLIDYAGGIFNE